MATSSNPPSPKPQPSVRFAHRLLRARDWQHRPQLGALCQWWKAGGRGVSALIGIGGAGKTAIAERFLRVLPGAMEPAPDIPKDDSLPPPRRLFVFSFYVAANPDEFFADLATWLAGDTPDDSKVKTYSYEQTVRLLERAGDCLLVMDGLEKVQDTGVRGGAFGRINDGRLRDLVLGVAGGYLPGVHVIITTRFRLYDPLAEGSPLYRPIPVEQLDEDTAVALLRKRGVNRGTDDRLQAVARDQGFHALSVDLVGGYITYFCDGDPALMRPDPLDEPAAEVDASLDPQVAAMQEQERKFNRLARRYHEALSANDPAAMALLQRVCLFRLGVDAKTLASIFTGEGKEVISRPALAALSERKLRGKLDLLVEMKLLERTPPTSPPYQGGDKGGVAQGDLYTVHPAVRDGFLAGLDAETAQRGHEAAGEGLTASLGGLPASGANPSDAATLDLLEEIVYHTLAAGHANEAWDIYWNRIDGFPNLGWRLGAYERGERICRAFAGGQPPETASLPDSFSARQKSQYMCEWALYLLSLGRLDAAAHSLERAFDIDTGKTDWVNVSNDIGNLAEVLLLAGRLTAGLRKAEEALRLAERADNSKRRKYSYACRARARALRGKTDLAIGDFRDALHWQHKHEGKTDRPLHSNRGIGHGHLLARRGQYEDARRLTEANKKVLLEVFGQEHQDIPKCNCLLADLAREAGDLVSARELLEQAHEWAIARDAKEPLCWSALVRAKIDLSAVSSQLSPGRHRHADQSPTDEVNGGAHGAPYDDVRAAIEEGLRIARNCGYGIFHIDLLLTRAQLALHEGNPSEAQRDVLTALDEGDHPPAESGLPTLLPATDDECGYAWGIAEARHLRAEALLLQAAQTRGEQGFTLGFADQLPDEVKALISKARDELDACLKLRERIQDPKQEETKRVIDQLDQGVLTKYPIPSPGSTEVGAVLKKEKRMTTTAKPRVFVSHSSKDKTFVRRLASDLRASNVDTWVDERELNVGDSIVQGISEGLKETDYLVVVLSKNSVGSQWVQAELNAALMDQLSDKGTVVLPVRIDDCEIPVLLRERVYADFRTDYNAGLASLLRVLEHETLRAVDAGLEPVIERRSGDPERMGVDFCRHTLSTLKLADLRRRLTTRLSREDLAAIWFDTFECPMDDDMPDRSKTECVIAMLVQARNRNILDELLTNICKERVDLVR